MSAPEHSVDCPWEDARWELRDALMDVLNCYREDMNPAHAAKWDALIEKYAPTRALLVPKPTTEGESDDSE